jgi:hypothetical protein
MYAHHDRSFGQRSKQLSLAFPGNFFTHFWEQLCQIGIKSQSEVLHITQG